MAARRKFDIVLFGATGFTGQLTAEYLARNGGGKLRWALAGRNQAKLQAVRDRIAGVNPAMADLDILQGDIDDAESIARIAGSTKVLITTVGPYVLHGEPLVAACAAAGTDYVDLTGEPEFVDLMWLRYHDQAKASGARIVHCCGFDSIPHDLGAWFTVQQLPEHVPLKVEGFVRAGGEISGGTLHSAVTAFSRVGEYQKVRKQRREREGYPVDRRIGSTRQRIRYEHRLGSWVIPFPSIDPQIVRRSACVEDRYGPEFHYGHYLQVKTLPRVAALVGGVGAAFVGAQFKLTRDRLLAIRDSGRGPNKETRERGWFRVRFLGSGGGVKVVTEVSGGDPGYGETAKMIGESALCLAFDRLPKKAGMLTPAQAMGNHLIERLQKNGISFAVVNKP